VGDGLKRETCGVVKLVWLEIKMVDLCVGVMLRTITGGLVMVGWESEGRLM